MGKYFYLDLWPVTFPMFYILDPDLAQQITVEHSQPKHPNVEVFMKALAGPGDLVSSEGAHWKKWRTMLNPGFAASHLMTLVPSIVNDGQIFAEKLAEYAATGKAFRLEEAATRLTVDIIGKVTLDVQLGTQRGENEMVTAFREQVQLLPSDDVHQPFKMWYPSGIYRRWRNARIMELYIGNLLEQRFAQDKLTSNGAPSGKGKQRKRVIVDLALEAYQSHGQKSSAARASAGLDREFKKAATTQIRAFIFAGHDTTSSLICYALYMLQQHPACLAQLRHEHNTVLGSVDDTPAAIANDPHILNRLEYTTSVIRETLRLWPPASSVRTGAPGYFARDPATGAPLPTDGMVLWIIHYAIHRDPTLWGASAAVFDPSRWSSAARLPDNAWRPFEKGPRNCIGQDLAMLEARVILALVVRRFDFELAFDALEDMVGDGTFYGKNSKGRQGKQDLDGEVLYQVLIGTAKPREGMPVRAKKVLRG